MKATFKRSLISALVTAAVAAPATSFATNGMFMIGYGAKSVAMGGVAIAFPQDALAGAANPAAVAHVPNQWEIGTELFKVQARARLGDLEQNSVASHSEKFSFFIIPHIGYAQQSKTNPKVSYGFSFVPAGGGGSRYQRNLFVNANNSADSNVSKPVGISLDVAQMTPTVAFKFNDTNTFGATFVLSFQKFRAIGLSYFSNFTSAGVNTTGLTDNGNAWSYGAGLRLGWLGKFMDNQLTLGAVATSKIYMTKFDKYDNLFAEQGALDTPANFGIGLAYKIKPELTAALDITYTLYEDVNAIGNRGAGTTGPDLYPVSPQVNSLGMDEGLGFGWKNQTVFKLGLAYDLSNSMTLRTGWNYGKSPIPYGNGALLFNILAPATTQHHFTLGGSYKTDATTEWSLVYMHAFGFTETGPTYIGGLAGATIQMRQNSIGVTYGSKF